MDGISRFLRSLFFEKWPRNDDWKAKNPERLDLLMWLLSSSDDDYLPPGGFERVGDLKEEAG